MIPNVLPIPPPGAPMLWEAGRPTRPPTTKNMKEGESPVHDSPVPFWPFVRRPPPDPRGPCPLDHTEEALRVLVAPILSHRQTA
jgi:hypothetical protein